MTHTWAILRCHPQSTCSAVRRLEAQAVAAEAGALAVSFLLEGELALLRIPAARAQRRIDGLWRHTCFEVFVRANDGTYREFNFSPSSEWAAYAFARYRDGGPLAVAMPPRVDARVEGDRLLLDALLPAGVLPARESGAGWRLGLTAVIEDAQGALSYWALEHAAGRPDFHHSDGFVLHL